MRKALWACFTLLCLVRVSEAGATTFNLNATLYNATLNGGSANAGNVNGTVTIDTVTGLYTGAALTATTVFGTFYFDSTPYSQGGEGPGLFGPDAIYFAEFYDPSFNHLELTLPADSLFGYSGGLVCSFARDCIHNPDDLEGIFSSIVGARTPDGLYPYYADFSTGTLTPEAVVTPEPASLSLLVTGCLLTAALYSRRRLHPVAVAHEGLGGA